MNHPTFSNPILSGFHPDPSICRVGEDYYMVTSSFVYFPGLPIFHSKDLVHWQQIGHGICRPDQLDYKNCETSLGLWAPTIRHHNGMFYIVNTFVSEGREAKRDNFIITASNPAGPWSDPVFVEGADGIDPSLFFDDDGRLWYTGNCIVSPGLYEGHHAIYLCELDSQTFRFIGNRTIIWDGNKTRSKWIEAPHIYKKDGWYYLIVAEGGTFTNHSVMMARSKTIDGDYEICPRNPIVSHRHLSLMSPISVVGHADIVETQNGEWWMTLLGVRPYEGFNYNLGRETFLVPVVWEKDGWLRIDTRNGLVNPEERLPNLAPAHYPVQSTCDNFDTETLGLVWNTVHPPLQPFYSLADNPGNLRLYLQPAAIHQIGTPAFVGRRQQHKEFQVSVSMNFSAETENEEAGLVLLSDDRFNYIFVKGTENGQPVLSLFKTENGERSLLRRAFLPHDEKLYLTLRGCTTFYGAYFGTKEDEYIPFSENLPASLLSSTVNEGFTGVYIGMYASSNKKTSTNWADFDWFVYQNAN